jgi:hypothetical protein
MIQTVVYAALLALAMGQAPETGAAAAPSRLERALGEVTAIDAGTRQIKLKTDTGEMVTVLTDDKTSFLRAQPGARDLAGATPLSLADVAVGDRLLARGTRGTDALSARQVVVMVRADIAQKHQQDQADWQRRGLAGVVTAIDPARQELTVEVRSLAGSQPVIVSTADGKPTFKRYAPESVRFSDARPSSFAELQVGDQVRVLGDRAADGGKVAAEQVVSGSFQILSGAVKAVEGGTVTLVDNETGRPLVVTVGPDAMVRRLPPEMAARLAMRGRGAAGAGRPGAAGGWQGRRAGGAHGGRPEGAGRPEGGEPGDGGRRMGPPTLQDMLERLPALPLAELKAGDQVAVSSTKGHDPARVTAVVLLAGIEPLLQSRPSTASGGETLGLAAGALDIGLGVP